MGNIVAPTIQGLDIDPQVSISSYKYVL